MITDNAHFVLGYYEVLELDDVLVLHFAEDLGFFIYFLDLLIIQSLFVNDFDSDRIVLLCMLGVFYNRVRS